MVDTNLPLGRVELDEVGQSLDVLGGGVRPRLLGAGPEGLTQALNVGVPVLSDNRGNGVRALKGDPAIITIKSVIRTGNHSCRREGTPEASGGTVVEDVHSELRDLEGVKEGDGRLRERRERVLVLARRGDDGETVAGEVGREDPVLHREALDEVAVVE